MTDNILDNGVSEFVANRQSAKIQYLQQENFQLTEQVKDLTKSLNLNKEILKITFETTKSSSNNSSDVTNTSNENLNKSIILKQNEENSLLQSQLKRLADERSTLQNKLLLQQQISEESQSFFKDIITDLEEKVSDLRRIIQDKEYAIQEIEKSRATIDQDGQMVKIREVVTPNEQSLRLHEELESTRQLLNKISCESQNITDQNNLLKETNFVIYIQNFIIKQNFKRQLIKLRVVLRSPVAYYKMKEFFYDDYYGNTDNNLELQNEIYQNPDLLLNDYNQDQQLPQVEQFQYQQSGNGNGPIKYLSNNERAIYQDKLQKSETLLKGFKELFDREKSKNNLLAQKFNDLQRGYANLEVVNNTIIQAMNMREEKIKKLQGEANYYRKQYANYLYLLKNKRAQNLNLSFERQGTKRPSFDQIKNEFKTRLASKTPQMKQQQPQQFVQKKQFTPEHNEEAQVQDDVNNPVVNVSILDQDQSGEEQQQKFNVDEYDEGDNMEIIDEDFDNNKDSQEIEVISFIKLTKKNVHPLPSALKKRFNALTIKTDEDEIDQVNVGIATSKPRPQLQQRFKTQSKYTMSIQECKQFLLNQAKELYLTYNLRMNNLQRKKLMDIGELWLAPQPIWHQKSSSDPLDYFTLNLQEVELKQPKRPKQDDLLLNKLIKNKKQTSNKYNPFYLDVSLIDQDKQQKRGPNKKIQINAELSFDNLLDGINQ